MSVRKLLLVLALLPSLALGDGYHAFDGTNDTWTGTFTTALDGESNTICAFFYHNATTLGTAIDRFVTLGNANNSENDTIAIQAGDGTSANTYVARATNAAGQQGNSTTTLGAAFDDTWGVMCGLFRADADRQSYVNATDGTINTSSRAVADALNDIRLGETMVAGNDYTGRLAYVTIWSSEIAGASLTAIRAGTNCPLKYDGATIVGHWSMQENSGTATNLGSDATGDLTRSGTDGFSATGGPGISCTPTYTAGPTNGTFTTTTLPFTYTPDQNGVTYAAACPNGQTIATGANVESGTCSGGAAAGTGNDSSTATVSDTVTITGLSAGTTYDVYIVHKAFETYSAISSLADRQTASDAPVFTVGPTEAPASDGYTISGTITCSGTCTVEAVACSPGDAVPTANEIEAGQCGGGNAALMNASEVWSTGVSDSFALTSANKPPRLDVYVSGTDGSSDTAVTSLTDQDRSARAGFAIHALTSISATSIFDIDSYFDPDVAAGDVIEYEDDTNEDADCNVSFEADGDFVLTPVGAGDCDGKRTFNISYEDVTSATTGLFTAPSAGNFTTDDLICNGNSAPTWNLDPQEELAAYKEDEAIATLALAGMSDDADGDSGTYAVSSGSLPNGLTLNASTGDITGTPDTEDENGETVTFSRTDECGDSDTQAIDFYIINTWTVPNCVGNTASECADEIVTAAPWRELDVGLSIGSLTCVVGVEGIVLSQDPAASAEAEPFEEISVTLSQTCSVSGRRRVGFGLGLGIP